MRLKKIINRGKATPMLGVRNEVEPPFSRSLLRRRGPPIDLEKSTVEHSLSSTEAYRYPRCVCVWMIDKDVGRCRRRKKVSLFGKSFQGSGRLDFN